jgi:4-amino-4-deoxy-L-arabinose transferase-like glycosyltransferase
LIILIVFDSDKMPLQLWDESRNANNALEMALSGHWLVPTYGGVPDHWNTKPPLLIWLIAALMRCGVTPLWALRTPSILAAFITLGLVWGVLRTGLRDAIAAAFGGALLLSSGIFVTVHVARTGDYNALESLFVLGYVLCVWRAVDAPEKPGWLWGAGACVVAAVMTKGVAGLLALPGCAVFVLSQPGTARGLLKNWRAWAAAVGAMVLCLEYYAIRELYDPGYVGAVIRNEWGGRFLTASENHPGGPFYYLQTLGLGFKPGVAFLPLVLLPILGRDKRRRDLALLTLLSAAGLLAVISFARTKLYWYGAPAVPLLCICGGLGIADGVRRLRAFKPKLGTWALVAATVPCVVAMGARIDQSRMLIPPFRADLDRRIDYGPFLRKLHDSGETAPVLVLDPPRLREDDPERYNPIVQFYQTLYKAKWRISVLPSGASPPSGARVITCYPDALAWLRSRRALTVIDRDKDCLLALVGAPV